MYNHPSPLIPPLGHVTAELQALVLPPDAPRTASAKRAEGKQAAAYSLNHVLVINQTMFQQLLSYKVALKTMFQQLYHGRVAQSNPIEQLLSYGVAKQIRKSNY